MAKPENLTAKTPLQPFVRKWQRQHLLWLLLWSGMAGLTLFFVGQLWVPLWASVVAGLGLALLILLGLLWWRPLRQITPAVAASWLDWQHPSLQHSSNLLLQPSDALPLPARLQQARVGQQLQALLPDQKPPVRLQPPLLALAGVLLLGMVFVQLWQPPMIQSGGEFAATTLPATDSARAQLEEVKRQLPELKEARIRLAPPAYTGLGALFLPLTDLEAPEGSRLTWQLVMNEAVRQVFLTNQKNDTLRFRRNSGGDWTAQLDATAPLFYRIGYATTTDTAFSPYLKISLLPDEAPRLRILAPDQYLLEQPGDPFAVSVEASDDYGLQDVYLSLTISRGRGEGVSFREEKIWLNSSTPVKALKKQLDISPRSLGMQPGDELYYRLEGFDTKPPRGQHRRSNTWFYQWKDTAQAISGLSSGLALDREPEYFRSQRQIIIDTEKLISTQRSTPVGPWEKANQDLAVDQKLLRLRYGKFLGEEFESTAGGYTAPHEDEEEEGEHEGHNHEEEGHDHHEEAHDHPEQAGGAEGVAALLQEFGHAHDTEEGATFYEESIKVKLKAALAEMWEAEKYLRLSQPRQALPYEYRALRMIKEVQQSSRIYVERVGLELPTLIPAEHRLKGEQAKILPESRQGSQEASDSLLATRQLLARLSFTQAGQPLDDASRQLLRLSSRELARLLLEGGPYMRYFYLLNSLSVLQESESVPASELQRVQQGLYELLPQQQLPARRSLPVQGRSFLRQTPATRP